MRDDQINIMVSRKTHLRLERCKKPMVAIGAIEPKKGEITEISFNDVVSCLCDIFEREYERAR